MRALTFLLMLRRVLHLQRATYINAQTDLAANIGIWFESPPWIILDSFGPIGLRTTFSRSAVTPRAPTPSARCRRSFRQWWVR